MPSSGNVFCFKGFSFAVWENVYEPAEDSFLFAENLQVKKDGTVLEIGTGCGLLGILAAEKAARVLAIDINPHAIRCAKKNAERNRLDGKINFVQGDLLAPLRREIRFDTILFNAPYLPTEENEQTSWIDRAWSGGIRGRQVIDRFIDSVADYLNPLGRIFLMQSSLTDLNETIAHFQKHNLSSTIMAKRDLPFFETLFLLEIKRPL